MNHPIRSCITVAPIFFMVLRHQSRDKKQVRSHGPVVVSTGQGTKGKQNNGGIKIGTMEVNALIGLGAANVCMERMNQVADGITLVVCKGCGHINTVHPKQSMKSVMEDLGEEIGGKQFDYNDISCVCSVCADKELLTVSIPGGFIYCKALLAVSGMSINLHVCRPSEKGEDFSSKFKQSRHCKRIDDLKIEDNNDTFSYTYMDVGEGEEGEGEEGEGEEGEGEGEEGEGEEGEGEEGEGEEGEGEEGEGEEGEGEGEGEEGEGEEGEGEEGEGEGEGEEGEEGEGEEGEGEEEGGEGEGKEEGEDSDDSDCFTPRRKRKTKKQPIVYYDGDSN